MVHLLGGLTSCYVLSEAYLVFLLDQSHQLAGYRTFHIPVLGKEVYFQKYCYEFII